MIIGVMTITLHANWVHSLKEKRMIVKSLIAKIKHSYNVSVIEYSKQDLHQTIVLAIAVVGTNNAQVDSVLEHIIDFVEANTEAQITDIYQEKR